MMPDKEIGCASAGLHSQSSRVDNCSKAEWTSIFYEVHRTNEVRTGECQQLGEVSKLPFNFMGPALTSLKPDSMDSYGHLSTKHS